MNGEAKLPYWQVNVPPHERTDECPEHLRGLNARDIDILSVRDADFTLMTWQQVLAEVAANRIDALQRVPSDLRRYIAFNADLRKERGPAGVTDFLLSERLRWTPPIKARGGLFEHNDDVKVLFNDWPYGVDDRIVHLIAWTKFVFEEDPETSDLTDATRAAIDDYVTKVFRSRVPAEQVNAGPPSRPACDMLTYSRSCGSGTGIASSPSAPLSISTSCSSTPIPPSSTRLRGMMNPTLKRSRPNSLGDFLT